MMNYNKKGKLRVKKIKKGVKEYLLEVKGTQKKASKDKKQIKELI